jgi:hypothetical protein
VTWERVIIGDLPVTIWNGVDPVAECSELL